MRTYSNYKRINQWFIEILSFDTSSDLRSLSLPSSKGQTILAQYLVEKLREIGIQNVIIDKKCFVFAKLPANIEGAPIIGLVAHMDTYCNNITGETVPVILENYSGGKVDLGDGVYLDCCELKNYVGHTLICSEGKSILGADDKAGIVEILLAIEQIINNPSIKHGEIIIAFTPDEEIGRGMKFFNYSNFRCDIAYTVDAGALGEINCKNANFAIIKSITITEKCLNVKTFVSDLQRVICECRKDYCFDETDFREGIDISKQLFKGNNIYINFMVRVFDDDKFELVVEKVKDNILNICDAYDVKCDIKIEIEYRNMYSLIENRPYVLDRAIAAFEKAGVEPKIKKMIGGSDSVRISNSGIPCINIFSGVHNWHTPYEYITTESMGKAIDVIMGIIEYNT